MSSCTLYTRGAERIQSKCFDFEQFCTNWTNKKLQQHYNKNAFKMEQEENKKEGINWTYIEFDANQYVLKLIEKKIPDGIIALLDQACLLKSTHETFAEELYRTFKTHNRFRGNPELPRNEFTIRHYAGDVTYQTELFPDKNNDRVVVEHQELLRRSEGSFVSGLFSSSAKDSSKQSKFSSKGSRFKEQLQGLFDTLSSTQPHYIRCVKPNNELKQGIFENKNVLQQLRCMGVMEAIRIRQVYENMRRQAACLKIQKDLRMHHARKVYKELYGSAASIQTGIRGMAARNELRFRRQTKAAMIIQSQCRRYLARSTFMKLKKAAITIQCAWRGRVALKEPRKLKMAARETGVLLAAKCKMEKQVARTWRLQPEKTMRADLEETKTQENANLQSALQAVEVQLREIKELLIKEREAPKTAADGASVIQEVPVVDHALVEKLTTENGELKAKVSSLEKRVDEIEEKLEKPSRRSELWRSFLRVIDFFKQKDFRFLINQNTEMLYYQLL